METSASMRDRLRGALLGLAVGDAVGTTLEFLPRGSFEPIDDMLGGGPFGLAPGQWTDDTSMALCLGQSLVACGGFDAGDQMARYLRWLEEGENACTGMCRDVGLTVHEALLRHRDTGESFCGVDDPLKAGNGGLMRLAPVPIYYHRDESAAVERAAESCLTTHGAVECRDACRLLAAMLLRAFAGQPAKHILSPPHLNSPLSPKVESLSRGDYLLKSDAEIRGSGYVVESLEAALWCFAKTDSFEAAILRAANLGDDADTTAAVCGQIAGAHYGESGIPASWLARLAWREKIGALAEQLIAGPRKLRARHGPAARVDARDRNGLE